ncbi:MAG: phosphoribosylformylglycinamidine synthase II [Nitriliruptoraceae bacterium]|jgi:phosphoribosylformylglycinamidine synthase II
MSQSQSFTHQPVTPFPANEALDDARARELGHELGLRGDEYDKIIETLDRVPTVSELGMYSVMWSEHCSYKSSKVHLATLPTEGPEILAGVGENAGVVDVGDGIAVAFKIESHNHPSFVEPYQGAATGVGGILRDIFTMGARPIAVMDPLRFGLPTKADGTPDLLQRRLVDGIVRGVGGYGNCVGVANIGGELVFDERYAGNPLVNVLAIGVMRADRLQLAKAEKAGDIAVLLGSSTGRDGIGGASVLASQEFDEGLEAKRPNVQVGDPFAEKQLIECCLDLYEADLISGIQDMGAAGIACSTSELASSASLGMDVDLDLIHLREPSMESWEVLCSESQERMMALVNPDQLDEVLAIAAKHGVPASVCGEVVDGDRLRLWRGGQLIADVPARSLADEGPTYHRPMQRPDAMMAALHAIDAEHPVIADMAATALALLSSPNIARPTWVTEQYDHLVGSGTILGPGEGDAGVVRLPDTRRGVAVSTDGNGRWCELDPREGARRVLAESFRNVACVGARPVATTNCLNFGNPERPDVMWQLAESIAGIGEAARALDVPITGGNVSLYNETRAHPDADPIAIYPTPVLGILGLLDVAAMAVGNSFVADGDAVLVLGAATADGLAGSEFQRVHDDTLGGVLARVDLDLEARLARVLHAAAGASVLRSAHDISVGGLIANLADSVGPGLGVTVEAEEDVVPAQQLFSEAPGRVVVTVAESDVAMVLALAAQHDVPVRKAGRVGGDRVTVVGVVDLPLDAVLISLSSGVPAALGQA